MPRWAALCVLCLVGCRAHDDLRLLEIAGVDPPQVEAGGTLRVRGEGFPLGLTATVRLDGTFHRPGSPAAPLRSELEGEVQTETLIEVPIPDAWIESSAGRGTFDGDLRIAFRTADGRRDVFADRAVTIDFLPDTSVQLGGVATQSESSHPASPDFGVALSPEETGRVGVRVERVVPNGLASAQGVRAGDRLVELDGVRLYSRRDFVPDPSRTVSDVRVVREGLDGAFTLHWPHAATVAEIDPWAVALVLVLGLVLGWLSPIALCLVPSSRPSVDVLLTRGSVVLVFAALLLCVPFMQTTTAWILMMGLLAALFSLAAGRTTVGMSFAFLVAATLSVMLLGRTASVLTIIDAQEGTPLRWYLLQDPASTLAFGGFLFGLHRLAGQTRLSASLYTAAAAVLGATLFLGGWGSLDPLIGIACLILKAGALLIAARFIRLSTRVATITTGLGLSFALLGTLSSETLAIPYWSMLAAGCAAALLSRSLLVPFQRDQKPVAL